LPFGLAVGITGHRQDALPPGSLFTIEERLRTALTSLARAASEVHAANAEFFSDAAPRLVFVSPLADGSDQIAAQIALQCGFELRAILPFRRDDYRRDLPEEARIRFDDLLSRSSCVLELPGDTGAQLDAYVMAGRSTMAHSDILIAVWDGLPARGRGGTGEVVNLAIDAGTPLVHISPAAAAESTLRWSAYDPAVVTRGPASTIVRPFTDEQVSRLLTALLAPPPDPRERRFFAQFQNEHRRKWRTRLEYPALLTLAGIARIGSKDIKAQHCSAITRAEWENYRRSCCEPHNIEPPIAEIEEWYEWSDWLASHFAQSYRSGQVFNFVSAALAVLIALSALVVPHLKAYLATAEFLLILAIIVNTRVGVRQQWHRRWLDYRQLAERLRPMRSLKLLGLAEPDPPGTPTAPVASRWIEWYAAAVWRATGCPRGRIDRAAIESLTTAISRQELRPQIAYHRGSATQIHKLDHRLERLALAVFACSIVSCIVLLIGLAVDKHWVERNFNWFTIASAGLPAIGAAIFGIRFEGDFGGSAVRSETTARTLEQIADELEKVGENPMRAADLVEQAARAMLADLDEWRLVNQQHDLSVG
jgi:hypothetical protein